MEALSVIWNEAIIRPMLNTLMVLYVISFSQMGIAIILLTVLVRVVTLPLTLKQVRQMRAMSTLQPRMREIPGTPTATTGPASLKRPCGCTERPGSTQSAAWGRW